MKTIYKVEFLKTFVTGSLTGMTMGASCTFPNLETATEYIAFLHRHRYVPVKSVGGGNYTVSFSTIKTETINKNGV